MVCGPSGYRVRAPGRTPEDVTTRTVMRRAAAVAGALILVVSSATNPSEALPAEVAPPTITTPVRDRAVNELLAARVERATTPPAARRAPRVRARTVKARSKPVSTPAARRAVTAKTKPARVKKARTAPVRRAGRLARAHAVVGFARAQVGDPYVYGADGPGSWDCSGLTRSAFAAARVRLPRRAASQSARGVAVSRRAARVGDLAFWGGAGHAYHVGIYLGRGWVLHSPRPGKRVQVARLWGNPSFRRLL